MSCEGCGVVRGIVGVYQVIHGGGVTAKEVESAIDAVVIGFVVSSDTKLSTIDSSADNAGEV